MQYDWYDEEQIAESIEAVMAKFEEEYGDSPIEEEIMYNYFEDNDIALDDCPPHLIELVYDSFDIIN